MKVIATTALALGLVAVPAAAQYGATAQQPQTVRSPAPATAPPAPQIKPSAKALKAIVDLQTAVNSKDWASVPAKAAAAQAVASTKEDRYLIARLQLNAAVAENDNAAIQAALDAVAQSGYLDQAKTASLYLDLGSTLFKDKQFARAETEFEKASALDPTNTEAIELLGRAQFLSGQKAQAAATFRKLIQASIAAGHKPAEETYRLAIQSAFDAKSPDAAAIAREWVTAYPSSESWRNALAIYRNDNHLDTEGTLDLLRLMQATGALKEPADYALFAEADADQNNFNEAQSVLDAGVAAHVIDPASPNIRQLIAAVRAKPKATTADLAAATKSAVNGMALLHIGDRYYAMGDYAKAIELYRMAQGKPGVDPAVANLHIGMVLARSGDKAGATAALQAVTGPRADIAKYWLIYLNQKA